MALRHSRRRSGRAGAGGAVAHRIVPWGGGQGGLDHRGHQTYGACYPVSVMIAAVCVHRTGRMTVVLAAMLREVQHITAGT